MLLPHILNVCFPYQINFKILRKFNYDTGIKMCSTGFDLNCNRLILLCFLSSALNIHRLILHASPTKILTNYLIYMNQDIVGYNVHQLISFPLGPTL